MPTKRLKNDNIRDLYNKIVDDKYGNSYEFQRWHCHPRQSLDYAMMHKAIDFHLIGCKFECALELGPAGGTWTKLLFKANPQARFDLVDISEVMKKQFFQEMRQQTNINYLVSDFINFKTQYKYDLFFSSRAIEYLENKEQTVAKIHELLNCGGRGIIITKNPQFRGGRRKNKRFQHSGQIELATMERLLASTGFKNLEFFPVIIRHYILDKFTLHFSIKTFEKCYRQPMTRELADVCECYMVKFEK